MVSMQTSISLAVNPSNRNHGDWTKLRIRQKCTYTVKSRVTVCTVLRSWIDLRCGTSSLRHCLLMQ